MLTLITANPFEWLFRWGAERTWNKSIIKKNNTHGLNTILVSYWTKIPCVALLAPRKTYYIDIDRAKGEALVNIIIVVYLKIIIIKWNCVMLNGDGNGNGKRSIGTVKRATKNVQLFLQHWCKTSWIAMLRVSPSAKKKNLQQIGLNVDGKTRNIANELVLHQCYLSTYLLPCYPRQWRHKYLAAKKIRLWRTAANSSLYGWRI